MAPTCAESSEQGRAAGRDRVLGQVDILNAVFTAIDKAAQLRFYILIGRAQYKLWDTPVLI